MTDFITGLLAITPILLALAAIAGVVWLAEIVLEEREARQQLEDAEDHDINHGVPVPPVAVFQYRLLFHAPEFKNLDDEPRPFFDSERGRHAKEVLDQVAAQRRDRDAAAEAAAVNWDDPDTLWQRIKWGTW